MKIATIAALSFVILAGTASAQAPKRPASTTASPSRTAAPKPAQQPTAPTNPTPAPAPAEVRTPMPEPVGTSGSSAAGASTANDYRLSAGDKLRIEVYKDDKLSQTLQVRPDGKITLPLVGDVAAAGRTSLELRDAIGVGLKDYITNPVITVIVVETTPQVVYVTGEVNKPGPVSLTAGHMSVLQALAVAGGFTDFANKKDVRILRKGPAGMQTLKFNYKDALSDGNQREPLQLQPGDTVVVK